MTFDERIRVGYGWRRKDKSFDGLNLSSGKLFMDTVGTQRIHRTELLKFVRDRQCTVVLVAYGDLGAGVELKRIKEMIAEYGGIIEGPNERGEQREKRKAGRNPKQEWTDAELRAVCPLWYDQMLSAEYVIGRAADITKRPQDRNTINRACGTRGSKLLKF
ncbi:MAG: hypothetical protein AAFR27_12355 [Pseudomonadota bacterium]